MANINKYNCNLQNMCLVFKTKHKMTLKKLVSCGFTIHWSVSFQTLLSRMKERSCTDQ